MLDNIGHRCYRPIFDFKYRYQFQKCDIGRSLCNFYFGSYYEIARLPVSAVLYVICF